MQAINAEQIDSALNFELLVAELKTGFAEDFGMPKRNVYELDTTDTNHDAFAVLPAWNEQVIGVKAFTYFPTNAQAGYESLYSKIMLFSRQHGEPLALVDGTRITLWRTAAVSAVASDYLSRKDSQHLVFFGSGNLAAYMIRAHLSVRQFSKVTLIARNQEKLKQLQAELAQQYPQVEFVCGESNQQTIASADLISCATGSPVPLFNGEWLSPGTHVDLIGNHQQQFRECDTTTICRADVYVDSVKNVLAEAGELLIPINEGKFTSQQVKGELADLATGQLASRQSDEVITVFKSVGTALSDLIAANCVYKAVKG